MEKPQITWLKQNKNSLQDYLIFKKVVEAPAIKSEFPTARRRREH